MTRQYSRATLRNFLQSLTAVLLFLDWPAQADVQKSDCSPEQSPQAFEALGPDDKCWRPEIVSISVNGRHTEEARLVYRRLGGAWLVPVAVLDRAGAETSGALVTRDGERWLVLHPEQDVGLAFEPSMARLDVVLDPEVFLIQDFGRKEVGDEWGTSEIVPAAFVDLSANLQSAGGDTVVSGIVQTGASGGFGLLQSDWAYSSEVALPIRLRTFWIYDRLSDRSTFTAGDAIDLHTRGMEPLGFGGLAWFTNFDQDPEYVPYSLPDVSGLAEASGRLSILLNNQVRLRETLRPGGYSWRDVPVPVGAGTLEVVSEYEGGDPVSFSENYYVSPLLLKAGSSTYSVVLGWGRQSAKDSSDIAYTRPLIRAGRSTGLTDWLTGSVAVEADAGLIHSKAIADFTLGGLAVASVDVAGSRDRHSGESGVSVSGSLSRQSNGLSLSLFSEYSSPEFQQLGGDWQNSKRSRYAGTASIRVWDSSLALSFMQEDFWGDSQARKQFRLGVSRQIGRGLFTLAGAYSEAGEKKTGIFLGYTLPLGVRQHTSFSADVDQSENWNNGFTFGKSIPAGEGIGYDIQINNVHNFESARARVGLRQRAFDVSVDAGILDGQKYAGANFSGGILATRDGVFAARGPAGGGILVDTQGLSDLGILLNNQDYGMSNERGLAFLPAVPFIQHTVRVNENDLPIDVNLSDSAQRVSTRRGGVSRVRFMPSTQYAETVYLRLPGGEPPPRGSPILADGDPEPLPVGRNGLAYLVADEPSRTFRVKLGERSCVFDFTFDTSALPSDEAEMVTCSLGPTGTAGEMPVGPGPSPEKMLTARQTQEVRRDIVLRGRLEQTF